MCADYCSSKFLAFEIECDEGLNNWISLSDFHFHFHFHGKQHFGLWIISRLNDSIGEQNVVLAVGGRQMMAARLSDCPSISAQRRISMVSMTIGNFKPTLKVGNLKRSLKVFNPIKMEMPAFHFSLCRKENIEINLEAAAAATEKLLSMAFSFA